MRRRLLLSVALLVAAVLPWLLAPPARAQQAPAMGAVSDYLYPFFPFRIGSEELQARGWVS